MKRWYPYFLSAMTLGAVLAHGQTTPSVTTVVEKPGVVTTTTTTTTVKLVNAPADLTYSTTEVIRLQQSGVSADVIATYIQTSNGRFQLSADDIIYCHKLGIPSALISAMIQRDQQLPAPAPAPVPVATTTTTVVQQPVQTVVVVPPAPEPVVYTTPYVEPVYISPYYSYPYRGYYVPAVSVGVGVGFGHCRHGWGGVGIGIGL